MSEINNWEGGRCFVGESARFANGTDFHWFIKKPFFPPTIIKIFSGVGGSIRNPGREIQRLRPLAQGRNYTIDLPQGGCHCCPHWPGSSHFALQRYYWASVLLCLQNGHLCCHPHQAGCPTHLLLHAISFWIVVFREGASLVEARSHTCVSPTRKNRKTGVWLQPWGHRLNITWGMSQMSKGSQSFRRPQSLKYASLQELATAPHSLAQYCLTSMQGAVEIASHLVRPSSSK